MQQQSVVAWAEQVVCIRLLFGRRLYGVMDVDEAAADGPSDDVRESKNPLEKMRVRLAAENYNKPNSYQTMPDDSDDEHTTGLYTAPEFTAYFVWNTVTCVYIKRQIILILY